MNTTVYEVDHPTLFRNSGNCHVYESISY